MKKRYVMPIVLVLALILGACAPAQESQDMAMQKEDDAMMEEEAMMEQEMVEDAMSTDHDDEMASEDEMMPDEMMAPAWFSVPLVDVNTGTTFTIDDFKGQVVLVETMAVWCSNCLRQQREVQELHAALGDLDDFVSIALDIDPNENTDILRSYAEEHGFDWVYVVAPAEVASQLGELYGQQVLNPPSTPILLVDRHGDVHILPFGIKAADELQSSVESLLEQM